MTRIFCKKNGQKRSILREIRAQTFYYPLYRVATILDSIGLYRTVLDCNDQYWTILGSIGVYWAEVGCSGLYWAALGCNGLYLFVLGSTWLLGRVIGFEKIYSLFGVKHHICIIEKICDVTLLMHGRTKEENGK